MVRLQTMPSTLPIGKRYLAYFVITDVWYYCEKGPVTEFCWEILIYEENVFYLACHPLFCMGARLFQLSMGLKRRTTSERLFIFHHIVYSSAFHRKANDTKYIILYPSTGNHSHFLSPRPCV